jgi:3-keto-L-gulonate-6-phosphate decarboxylase/transcriptional regulator with XRE-family HTH domain
LGLESVVSAHEAPIGRLIERARVSTGRSQYALAERLRGASGNPSVTREYVARWENGRRIPTPYWRQFLSAVLDVPRDDLDRAAAVALRLRDGNGVPETDDDSVARRSVERTAAIVASLAERDRGLPYLEPADAVAAVSAFLDSDRRVFVLAGPPGAGKSRLVQHVASGPISAAVQLHDVASWRVQDVDVAAEVLRYASLEPGADAALTLERKVVGATGPLLVVIDGISTAPHLDSVARQVDGLLRQVTGPQLRFALVVRTPPEVELTRYPVLVASTFGPAPSQSADHVHVSFRLGPWGPTQARRAWNAARGDAAPEFDHLPLSVRRMVCLPLYQRLVLSVGACLRVPAAGGYAVVDECVRSIAHLDGRDVGSVIDDVARRVSATADELPSRFRERPAIVPRPSAEEFGRLARVAGDGSVLFEHDVVREYFLGTHVSDVLLELGSPAVVAAALDELAEAAQASATVRGVLEFAVQRLDGTACEVLADAMVSSFVNSFVTAPLMVEFAGHGATWFSSDVVRSLMFRSISDRSLPLAQSLLKSSLAHIRAGDGMARWVVDGLRAFGVEIWGACAAYLSTLDARGARRLLDGLDLRRDDDAAFFAVHLRWFGGAAVDKLPQLLTHEDWRVRAALASAVSGDASMPTALPVSTILERLVLDRDYKVRAAVASILPTVTDTVAPAHVAALMGDPNWHVRERTLYGLMAGDDEELISQALERARHDPAWRACPTSVAVQLSRLRLLKNLDASADAADETTVDAALFALLREIRTGHLTVPGPVAQRLVAQARRSTKPLTVREAKREGPLLSREQYRGLRGARAVQVALDVHDVDHAQRVAASVASVGVDFIEVGDPLIKRVGLDAIRAVKETCPQVRVVAEMMSADWGRDQVAMAAEAGADAVLLIGPATTASVRAAVQAGLRLGVPVALDVSTAHADAAWVRSMESAGVDALAVTTNIDLGVGGRTPLQAAQRLRRWTRLPVLVSGGFSPADRSALASPDWDVLVIGRSVAEATDPAGALRELYDTLGYRGPRQTARSGERR